MGDDVIDYVLKRGWREMPDQFKPHARAFYATRKDLADLPHCNSNKKPPAVCLWWYPPYEGVGMEPTFEVEVCGESEGVWLKFRAYGLCTLDEVKKALKKVRAAWTLADQEIEDQNGKIEV